MEFVNGCIPSLLPAQWCQAFFASAAAGVLAVAVLPSRPRKLLLNYGARGSNHDQPGNLAGDSWPEAVIYKVTAWTQVPHAWFVAFYATSLACSAFWAYQYAVNGSILRLIASSQRLGHPVGLQSQSLQAVIVAWALIALQGARRLCEQIFVVKASSTTMWVVHWLLGLSFYACLSIAVWVEGGASILDRRLASALVETPSATTVLGSAVFLIGSAAQFRCHRHLASLKKYSLPTEGLFAYFVCPHYTCECILYLSLAFVAAPDGQLLNRTVLTALLFVGVNLGVTAHGTRQWYEDKFGAKMTASRWTMIPIVY